MKKEIEKRVMDEADFVLLTGKTVRDVSKVFGVSKSTVHNDLKFRLAKLDKNRWKGVKKILKNNLNQRHIRGGIATKKKYEKLKKEQEKTTK